MDHPTDHTPQFASISLGLVFALRCSLEELAKFHGGKAGRWLDDLEQSFIKNVKGSHSEGLSMDVEIKAADAAISFIKLAVETARMPMTSK